MSDCDEDIARQDDDGQAQPPGDLEVAWRRAQQGDVYMVAIWCIEDGQLHLFRQTQNFPLADFDNALDMLGKNLRESTASEPI